MSDSFYLLTMKTNAQQFYGERDDIDAILKSKADFSINFINGNFKEVAGRYYYEEGRVRLGLRNDIEVKEAVKLLKDKKRYTSILEGK